MIGGTVAADLGQRGPMKHNKEALATVTGIVDGTGTLGAAIGQVMDANISIKIVAEFSYLQNSPKT